MKLLMLFTLVALAVAVPTDIENRATSCTLTGSSISTLSTVKSSCTSITIKDLTVPAGKTLDLSNLKTGTTVTFKGTIKFGYKEWAGPLIKVSGTNIIVTGSSGHVIDGQGAKYWDGKGGNGGKTKPKFFSATLKHSTIKNLNIKNTPKHCFSVSSCTNITLSGITINNKAGQSGGGHNTDGFDVSNSNYVYIKNSYVYNQDDCLAINSGNYIYFQNNYCWGGHGISVGSVGGRSNNVVKTVVVKNCQIVDSTNGVRVKTIAGATGSVTDVTYQDITLKNVTKYGITIRGDYQNSGSTGTATSGVPIKSLTLKNIKGTVGSSAYKIYVLVKGASNWKWSGISISGGRSSNYCSGIPSGVSC